MSVLNILTANPLYVEQHVYNAFKSTLLTFWAEKSSNKVRFTGEESNEMRVRIFLKYFRICRHKILSIFSKSNLNWYFEKIPKNVRTLLDFFHKVRMEIKQNSVFFRKFSVKNA